jgi:FixJ family two-component response regulator
MTRTDSTIAVIDDDESVRRALCRLIRSAGLSVETYATAEDFLDQVAEKMPACLILDVRMPGMSGLELQNLLAADNRRIPIVFITAHEDEHARLAALGAGGVAFLQKPFDDCVLLGAVVQALSQTTEGSGGP